MIIYGFECVYTGNSDAPDDIRIFEATRCLLVVVPSPPVDQPLYQEFIRKVNEYNEQYPFFFPNPFGIQKTVLSFLLPSLYHKTNRHTSYQAILVIYKTGIFIPII